MKTFGWMPLLLAAVGAAIGCGGGLASSDSESPGGDRDASSALDARIPDTGLEPDADVDPGEDPACDELRARIEKLRLKAQTCCPACNSVQCMVVSNDICCPISVNHADPEFDQAVGEFMVRCDVICPAVTCPAVPSGVCDPETRTCI